MDCGTAVLLSLFLSVVLSCDTGCVYKAVSDTVSSYNGTVSRTINGNTCCNWQQSNAQAGIVAGTNYCRNKQDDRNMYCYVGNCASPTTMEYCDVGTYSCPICTDPVLPPTSTDPLTYPCIAPQALASTGTAFMPRIVGGSDAIPHEFPFFVAIHRNENFLCGGSLIHKDWLITAAHCTFDPNGNPSAANTYTVKIGAQNYNDTDACVETRSIVNILRMPSYNPNNGRNDLAFFKLNASSNYPPITLYHSGLTAEDLEAEGTMASIIGHGTLRETDLLPSLTLQKAMVPIYNQAECQTYWTPLVDNTEICAAFLQGKMDTCQGDSGGPLFVKRGTTFILLGTTAYGSGCALIESPAVYTRISAFYSWICASGLPPEICRRTIAPTVGWPSAPTNQPSNAPTKSPTPPTSAPTTKQPTLTPTTKRPTRQPTRSPTTKQPTRSPTTKRPTAAPTKQPTRSPTTRQPTRSPTTRQPTRSPTTKQPTRVPTKLPTHSPTTKQPTRSPTTKQPTRAPTTRSPTTRQPTRSPTTKKPTAAPTTKQPTRIPTKQPTRSPTTKQPTAAPTTRLPTAAPTTARPTLQPTPPTPAPTSGPSGGPTTRVPTTAAPSSAPTRVPTTRVPTTTAPSRSPTTRVPTTAAPLRAPTPAPTRRPTTPAPSTRVPTTRTPSRSPSTRGPTTAAPSRTPSTPKPTTPAPTTRAPTQRPTRIPTLSPTTRSPTTHAPSASPSTPSPTLAPTTLSPSIVPTRLPTTRKPTRPTARPTDDDLGAAATLPTGRLLLLVAGLALFGT